MTARVLQDLPQMGSLKPRPHRDVSGAAERGHGKAQPSRLAEQEATHATPSSAGHDPLEKRETDAV